MAVRGRIHVRRYERSPAVLERGLLESVFLHQGAEGSAVGKKLLGPSLEIQHDLESLISWEVSMIL